MFSVRSVLGVLMAIFTMSVGCTGTINPPGREAARTDGGRGENRQRFSDGDAGPGYEDSDAGPGYEERGTSDENDRDSLELPENPTLTPRSAEGSEEEDRDVEDEEGYEPEGDEEPEGDVQPESDVQPEGDEGGHDNREDYITLAAYYDCACEDDVDACVSEYLTEMLPPPTDMETLSECYFETLLAAVTCIDRSECDPDAVEECSTTWGESIYACNPTVTESEEDNDAE